MNALQLEIAESIDTILFEFESLKNLCEYKEKNDSDCKHPDQEFNCMNCQISICLLLGDLQWR